MHVYREPQYFRHYVGHRAIFGFQCTVTENERLICPATSATRSVSIISSPQNSSLCYIYLYTHTCFFLQTVTMLHVIGFGHLLEDTMLHVICFTTMTLLGNIVLSCAIYQNKVWLVWWQRFSCYNSRTLSLLSQLSPQQEKWLNWCDDVER